MSLPINELLDEQQASTSTSTLPLLSTTDTIINSKENKVLEEEEANNDVDSNDDQEIINENKIIDSTSSFCSVILNDDIENLKPILTSNKYCDSKVSSSSSLIQDSNNDTSKRRDEGQFLKREHLVLANDETKQRVKVYYESKQVGQHELRLKYVSGSNNETTNNNENDESNEQQQYSNDNNNAFNNNNNNIGKSKVNKDNSNNSEPPVVFFVDILNADLRRISSHDEQVSIDEVSNEIASTKFNVRLTSALNEQPTQQPFVSSYDDNGLPPAPIPSTSTSLKLSALPSSSSSALTSAAATTTKTTTTRTKKTTKVTKTTLSSEQQKIIEQDSLDEEIERLAPINSTRIIEQQQQQHAADALASPLRCSSVAARAKMFTSLTNNSNNINNTLQQQQQASLRQQSLADDDDNDDYGNNSSSLQQANNDFKQQANEQQPQLRLQELRRRFASQTLTNDNNYNNDNDNHESHRQQQQNLSSYYDSEVLRLQILDNIRNKTFLEQQLSLKKRQRNNQVEDKSERQKQLFKVANNFAARHHLRPATTLLTNNATPLLTTTLATTAAASTTSEQPIARQRTSLASPALIRKKSAGKSSGTLTSLASQTQKQTVNKLSSIFKKFIQPTTTTTTTTNNNNNKSESEIINNSNKFYSNQLKGQQDYFSTSKRIYLLPARDPFVTIETRDALELIEFAESVELRLQAKSASLSSRNKYNFQHLFKSYNSLSRRSLRLLNSQQQQQQQQQQQPLKGIIKYCNTNQENNYNQFQSNNLLTNKNSSQLNNYNSSIVDHHLNVKKYLLIKDKLELILLNTKAKVKMPSGKSDKATIVDNKDGTIKLTYEPKEIGQHELSVRYNDETIDDIPTVFYVDAVGASKKKITAYGAGLTHGIAGETSLFCINTGGVGSSKLNVTVEGPSKSSVNLVDNKDGIVTVSYTTSLPGEYKIKVSFDGKQVIGSPFVSLIHEDSRQRNYLGIQKGFEKSLNVKGSEDDLKTLCAIVTSPCGYEEPCYLKLLSNGEIAAVFTPREQGDHLINAKRSGNHISGSPFKFDVLSRDVGDARQVKLSGKALKEGTVNCLNEITVNTKDAGCGFLGFTIEGPAFAELTAKEASDGSVKLCYNPPEPGSYSLIVRYADKIVPNSPFIINVTGKSAAIYKETLRKFRKVIPPISVNSECHFNFKMHGTSAYDLSAKIRSPQGNSEDVSVKDKGDFEYQVSFVPKETGLYALTIRNKDIHVIGSPFPYSVGSLQQTGAHRVRCGGAALVKGLAKKLNEFDIFTREAGAGELRCTIEGASKPKLSFKDRGDGSCIVGYIVDEPGEYKIKVLFNDIEVPDSPFKTFVMPQTGDVAKIELGPMPPENMIQLNKPCNLLVIMNGAKGNIEAKVKLPDGKLEDCFASPIDAENWGVRFIPRQLGVHQVHIKFNKGSAHIPQSPVYVRVGHDNADPAEVVAIGHGLKDCIVNHATDFIVDTSAAGRASLETSIQGPTRCPLSVVEVDEGYRFYYTPLTAGDYIISVKYNNSYICGSPFKTTAIKHPGSKTIADPGTHDVSTITISTSERAAKQKVEHMPKFKSDASRVYCKGMGLKKAFANKPNTITVNCSEAGFNMISASFLGPTRNTIHDTGVKHMGGSIFQITYMCKDKGDAILVVKYGDEQIPGSPFRLEVS